MLNIWRVELTGTMGPLSTLVTATLSDATCNQTINVFRPESGHRLGIGRGGGQIPKAKTIRAPTPTRSGIPCGSAWKFLTGEFKLICEAKAYDDLPVGGSGGGHLWWLDFPSGPWSTAASRSWSPTGCIRTSSAGPSWWCLTAAGRPLAALGG